MDEESGIDYLLKNQLLEEYEEMLKEIESAIGSLYKKREKRMVFIYFYVGRD